MVDIWSDSQIGFVVNGINLSLTFNSINLNLLLVRIDVRSIAVGIDRKTLCRYRSTNIEVLTLY